MYQEIFKKMPIRTQDEKRAEFVEQRQIDRAVRFYQNRGRECYMFLSSSLPNISSSHEFDMPCPVSVAPLLNDGKSNFGNDLRITHVYSRDLGKQRHSYVLSFGVLSCFFAGL